MFVGGKFAELWTDAIQGIMMMAITFIILVASLKVLGGLSGFKASLVAQDPQLWAAFSTTKAFSPLTALFFFMFYFCLITPYNMPSLQGCKTQKK
jgi:Na+/pantothenate symporter